MAANDVDAEPPAGLTVATFNIWGIPFASHAALSRPGRLGDVAAAAVLGARPPAGDERIVLCFQEAWGFKTGCGQPCVSLARALERCLPSLCTTRYVQIFNPRHICTEVLKINSPCTLLASVFAALSSLCLPCAALRDDAIKSELVASLKRWGLPFAVGQSGNAGIVNNPRKLMDSGLLIVSSVAPMASGFVPYAAVGVEGVANKGFLWALLPPTDATLGDGLSGGGQLVVTTHQHADQPNCKNPGATRALQRAELLAGLASLRAKYKPALVVVCGDFNEDAEPRAEGGGLHADFLAGGLTRLTAITKGHGTCIKDDGTGNCEELDHLYAGSEHAERICYEPVKPLRTPWSDHSLLWVNRIRMPTEARLTDVTGPKSDDLI